MSHASLNQPRQAPATAISQPETADETLTMRQLRHLTKNALQRIIAQLATADLRATPAGETLADDIERRIRLSARMSDALFGLTTVPGPLNSRLDTLCHSAVALMADPVQTIRTMVSVKGGCPVPLEASLLQIAHEMVTNAVKHGLHMRLTGEIRVELHGKPVGRRFRDVTLTVSDDGWGPEKSGVGEGLTMMQLMAEQHGGTVCLYREPDWTVARLHIPGPA